MKNNKYKYKSTLDSDYRSECHDQQEFSCKSTRAIRSVSCKCRQFMFSVTPKQLLNSETPTENIGPEKTTKIYFTVILKAILYKEGLEKEW